MPGAGKILLGVVGILAAWGFLILAVSFFWIGEGLGGGGLEFQPKWFQTTVVIVGLLSGPLAVAVYLRRSLRKSAEEFLRMTQHRIVKSRGRSRNPGPQELEE
jgi:hypothetical protein